MTLSPIRQNGALFLDAEGAEMRLRGVNLGGDSKVPWPAGGTQFPSDFSDHRDVSFIGRPFPLEEADEHLRRIAYWGFNTLRLLTTWEAVEHRGPGLYDEAYLDFFSEVVRRAGEYGLYVFVDFHQDVWSRMSGGDGAPGWTFEAAGLDFTRFDAANAAHVMQARYDYTSEKKRQAAYPQMSWGSNYRLPANAIMWSLFWGGAVFTPRFQVEGENIQSFLQDRYLGAMNEVARRLADMPHVIGFDTLNEPGTGWIGQKLSYRHLAASAAQPERPRVGPALAPLDALAMAQGVAVTVPVLARDKSSAAVPTDVQTFNAQQLSIWRKNVACPFEAAGAYRIEAGAAQPLEEDFFRVRGGKELALSEDAYAPFFHRVAQTIRAHQPAWSVFAEMDAFAHVAGRRFPADMPERSVNASHWYDVNVLYLKRFDPTQHKDALSGASESGEAAIAARYRRQLGEVAHAADDFSGGAPTLIGEFGIPYDLDEGAAYEAWARGERDGVWKSHETALGLMYDAIDVLGLHATQWNYTASNRNDLRIGDNWNQEDLSIFSRDQEGNKSDLSSGGRALGGFCRPYARRVQGRVKTTAFHRATRIYRVEFTALPHIAGATEIYAPKTQYPDGFVVRVEGAPADVECDQEGQIARVRVLEPAPVWISIEPASAL